MKKIFALLFAIALVGRPYATTYTSNSVDALEQNDQADKKKKKSEAKETPSPFFCWPQVSRATLSYSGPP